MLQAQADSGFSGNILIAVGDSVIWRRSYGAQGLALTPRSAFWIASITKSFTAAAVQKLCGQRRLALDDSLPSFFPDAPADKRAITVRQLLLHTAGFGSTYSGGGISTRAAAVKAILSQPLARTPGSGYQYEDDSYELLGAIVEVVTREPWDAFVQRELLSPAGLLRTGFWCRRAHSVPLPVAGAHGMSSRCSAHDAGGPGDDLGHRGANGMSSTLDDLLQWSHVHATPHAIGFSGPMEVGVPRLLVRREGDLDVFYSGGARIYRRGSNVTEVMLSGNGDDGHTSIVRILESGMTIVVLSNAGSPGGTTWSSRIAERIAPRG
ncbi:MAG: serine hydrolase domain-containing protein [Gemmatimonadales bacterium]